MILAAPLAFSKKTSATSDIVLGDIPYELIYDSNLGSEAPARDTVKGNENYAMIRISSYAPTRSGYIFEGWSKIPTGEAEIHAGDLLTITSRTTILYAVWSPVETVVSDVLSTESESGSTEPLGEFYASRGVSSYPSSIFLYAMFLSIFLFAFGALLTYRLAKQLAN